MLGKTLVTSYCLWVLCGADAPGVSTQVLLTSFLSKYVLQKHPSWIKVFLHLPPSQWLSAESCQTQMAFPTLRVVFWCCHWILSFGSMPGSKLEFPKAHPTRPCKALMLRRSLLMKLAWISLGYLLSSQMLRLMCVARLSVRKPLSLTGICRNCLFLDISTG